MIQHCQRAVIISHRPQQPDQNMTKSHRVATTGNGETVRDRFTHMDLRKIKAGHSKPCASRQVIQRMQQFRETVPAETHQPSHRGMVLMCDQIGPDIFQDHRLRPIQRLGTAIQKFWKIGRIVLQHRFERGDFDFAQSYGFRPKLCPETVRHERFNRTKDQSMHKLRL